MVLLMFVHIAAFIDFGIVDIESSACTLLVGWMEVTKDERIQRSQPTVEYFLNPHSLDKMYKHRQRRRLRLFIWPTWKVDRKQTFIDSHILLLRLLLFEMKRSLQWGMHDS